MDIKYKIEYHQLVAREDIPSLSEEWKIRIKESIENKLTTYPEIYGKPLRYSLKGYRKLRVGDYRVVFKVQKNIVKILAIKHRENIYKTQRKEF
ncbi:MAG: type II toxin-antitoxin system RelE/ParE family toxin [Candidatus Paceibacterota bacterium]